MYTSVSNYFQGFSQDLEGLVDFMYLDIRNLVTIGIGNMIEDQTSGDPADIAVTLPFVFKDTGAAAAATDIRTDFTTVKANPGLPSAASYGPLTKLHLLPADLNTLFSSQASSNESTLTTTSEFSDEATWPADAQLALYSMAWAMGPAFGQGGKWPNFRADCAAKNWSKAASDCHMDDSANPGLVPRNWVNEILFIFAARAVANGRDLTQLTFPSFLLTNGTLLDMGSQPQPARWATLQQGASGQAVTSLQTLLFGAGAAQITGNFDSATDAAVRTFQGAHTDNQGNPLGVDGVVGPQTWRALVLAN